ncbi:MAG: glycosyl transferase [Anaerolineae bacterium]|nr:glycosyl transferase [Anaerolineae bacterium]
MRYGQLSPDQTEYVIERPDTPTPWINYISNSEGYCGIVSQSGGGFSFHKDPRDRRITKYRYNNVPVDRPGRYFYIKDRQDGVTWSPTWQPTRTNLDHYRCTHGQGYTTIEAAYKEIESRVTYFVPVKGSHEVWHLRLDNTGQHPRRFSIFAYSEYTLWCEPESRNIQWSLHLTRGDFQDGFVTYNFIEPHPAFDMAANADYVGDRPGLAYMTVVGAPIKDFDCVRDRFLGMYHSESDPQGIENGQLSNSILRGGNGCAALRVEVELAAGAGTNLIVLLGYADTLDQARQVKAHFANVQVVADELEQVKQSWRDYLSVFRVETPDAYLNAMINTWNQYQCKTTFDWSRYISFYENGEGRGMGTRDSSQDTLAVVAQMPDRVRARIIEIFSTVQLETGDCYHIFFPLLQKGELRYFSDDTLWLVQMVYAYMCETGHLDFLNEMVPYAESDRVDSIYDHLKAALDFTAQHTGPHGFPLILTADWNDTLHLWMTCEHPESVLVAEFYVYALKQIALLAERLGKTAEAADFTTRAAEMVKRINTIAWDGAWYLRGYGSKVIGTHKNDEAKLFLNPQTWAVISGAALPERALSAMDSVHAHLASADGIKAIWPTFQQYDQAYGLMSRYVPGRKENGIFAHANSWAIVAEALLGRGSRALDYYQKITPIYKNDQADVTGTEPYVYCQTIASDDSLTPGMGANSWLTGTAAWMFVAVTQYLLGVQPELDGLAIRPNIPDDWPGFTFSRRFRGCTYFIEVKRTGCQRITVDGAPITGCIIPPSETAACRVVVEL